MLDSLNLMNYLALALLTCLCAYLWALVGVYFFSRRDSGPECRKDRSTRFAFVVPAHNEEGGIAATVRSLLRVQYPATLFDVIVIADNCTDATAEVARKEGALCLERRDDSLRGKGYALRFAFEQLLSGDYDAFVVIDADSVVSSDFLAGLDRRFQAGQGVVQVYNGLSNPDDSVLTYLFQVGNLIENKLFWESKDRLGLPVVLRGNGMCFSREVLARNQWDSFSIVEDTEYALLLLERGEKIRFAPEVGVYARQPGTIEQARVQRVRWASGNATVAKGRALQLITRGLLAGDLARADLGLTLVVGSRPLLLLGNLVLLASGAALGNWVAFGWALLLLLGQVAYIGLGIVMNGFSPRKLGHLLLSPFYLAWLSMVSVLGLAGYKKDQWLRTTRT